jgi:prevent-host-death family protein
MSETINLSEARKNLPRLVDRVRAGHTFVMSRRGHGQAVLISLDEYQRLKTIEQQQRIKDFNIMLTTPPADALTEDDASQLAVEIVREQRARRAG